MLVSGKVTDSAKTFGQNLESPCHHPLNLTSLTWQYQHTHSHKPFVVFWSNSYVVRLSDDKLCH